MSKIVDKLHELTRKLDDIYTPETDGMRIVECMYLSNKAPEPTLVSADCPYCNQRVFVSKGVAALVLDYLFIEDKRHAIFIVSDACPLCGKNFSINLTANSTITFDIMHTSKPTRKIINGKVISGG